MESLNHLPIHYRACNVLVIGSGGAGLRAAITAHLEGAEVHILGKRPKRDAHTVLASGGINAALGTIDPDDNWQHHFFDTRKEGYFIGDPLSVEILCKQAPEAVLQLEKWGCPFAKTAQGLIDQRYFGAHRYRRTCYAGDWTGRAIIHTLVDKVEELKIPIMENQYVWKLLQEEGSCFGALSFNLHTGQLIVHQADCVVLATGGHTRLWLHSTSRQDENTGDGMALALQEGLSVADMEFVQFHPTGMTHPFEWVGVLVTEAVRGEGGILRNKDQERYMKRYDPERLELSTRDRIALANYQEIMSGRGGPHGGVFLDITHLDKKIILEKLPRMYRQFVEAQMIDISKEYMEVAPTAHYSMGGVVVNPTTHETAIENLFAVGEVTSGVHGANRLGGNSLAETQVFGNIVGKHAAENSQKMQKQIRSPLLIQQGISQLKESIQEGEYFARPLQRKLREVMWQNCGVVRSQKGLENALKELDKIDEQALHIDVRPTSEGYRDLANVLDLKASLCSARATVIAALARKESRGAHQREDFPNQDENYLKNFILTQKSGEFKIKEKEIPPLSPYLKSLVEQLQHDLKGRLLE